jgi:cbb3-type cytochrome oxidase subunit 3
LKRISCKAFSPIANIFPTITDGKLLNSSKNSDEDEADDTGNIGVNAPNTSQSYPESVQFEGVTYTSLKQVHISAFLIVLVGVLVAYANPLVGFPVLIAFLLLVLGVEAWMIRKSRKQLRITLHLRQNPVEATQGSYRIGTIASGSIDTDMENPNELGFRPAPNRNLIVWTFDSVEDKNVAAKRLLEYLPQDRAEKSSS